MQIHELTQLMETSIADRIRSAGTAIKQGYTTASDNLAQANTQRATAQQQKVQAQAAKSAQALQRQGYGTAATGPVAQSTVATAAKKSAPLLRNRASQRTKIAVALPGQESKSFYYKTATGWTNELGQAITNPGSIDYLEKQITAPVATNAAPAVNLSARQAPAVTTAGDFNSTLTQLQMNTNQLAKLKDKIAQDPSFADVFSRTLGLKR